jgi:hypothetical protein
MPRDENPLAGLQQKVNPANLANQRAWVGANEAPEVERVLRVDVEGEAVFALPVFGFAGAMGEWSGRLSLLLRDRDTPQDLLAAQVSVDTAQECTII